MLISINSLIAVLFKVILIVMANPNIPQDVKDSVFTEITTAIGQENQSEPVQAVQAPVSHGTPGGTTASPVVAPVVKSSNMEATIAITKTAPLSVSIAVTGDGWTKAYYSIVKKIDGEDNVSDKGFVYPDEPTLVHSFEESMAGTFETSWTLYSGTGKDNRRDTGKVLSSGSGSIVIGE